MGRLTQAEWENARADFEIGGLTITQIAQKYQCAKSAVSMRAKEHGWQAGKTEQAIQEKSNAIISLVQTELHTEQKLNRVEQVIFDRKVQENVEFRLQNDADMEAVRDKLIGILPATTKVKELKMIMEALKIQREARLGKAPETAIQINNNNGSSSIIDELMQKRLSENQSD